MLKIVSDNTAIKMSQLLSVNCYLDRISGRELIFMKMITGHS